MRRPLLAAALAVSAALGAAAPAAASCAATVDVPEPVRAARVVIFGEIHGTAEMPAFVGHYLCTMVHAGRRVILGLEMMASEQAALDAYLASDGSDASRAALVRQPHWQGELHDGRSSRAMLELIDLVRRLRQQGHPASLLAFDAWPKDKTRDHGMADQLRAAHRAAPQAQLVVLVGNVHAMKTKGLPGLPGMQDFEPMAYALADLSPLSLNAEFDSGTAWLCRQDRSCGETPLRALPSRLPKHVGITLRPPRASADLDGEYFVGPVTASPPAAHTTP